MHITILHKSRTWQVGEGTVPALELFLYTVWADQLPKVPAMYKNIIWDLNPVQ